MTEVLNLGTLDPSLAQEVAPEWWQKLFSCVQCGSCSAFCTPAVAGVRMSAVQAYAPGGCAQEPHSRPGYGCGGASLALGPGS